MKLAVVLPRNMSFGPRTATAIDLCAHDYVVASRFRASARVFAEPVDEPFDDVAVELVAPGAALVTALRRFAPDVILVEQHRPSAVALARALPDRPVALRRHGLEPGGGALRRWRLRREHGRLAVVIAVSEVVRHSLLPVMAPGVPLVTIHNALDFAAWTPAPVREKTVLFVGRAAPEKGALEAAEATRRVLLERPDWSALFLLAAPGVHPGYSEAVTAQLAGLGARAQVAFDVPHARVKLAFESAAIALAPSLWTEPFGRIALEAFAGGAALIASRSGGFLEIAGDDGRCAVLSDSNVPDRLAFLLKGLVDNEAARDAYTRAARARGEARFSLAAHAERMDRVLDGLRTNSRRVRAELDAV